jgi:hypothetical protein
MAIISLLVGLRLDGPGTLDNANMKAMKTTITAKPTNNSTRVKLEYFENPKPLQVRFKSKSMTVTDRRYPTATSC